MGDLLHEMFSNVALAGVGTALMLFGAFLWTLPRVYRRLFQVRASHAAALRTAGKEEKALRLERETAAICERVTALGRVLIGVGMLALVASVFTHG